MSRWVKYALGFVVVALLGLSIKFPAETPIVAMVINDDPRLHSLVLLGLSMLVVFVAGCMLPRGFWLWGVAVVSLRIPMEVALIIRDVEMGRFNESEVWDLAFVAVFYYVWNVLFFTFASAVGAGLRLLWHHLLSGQGFGREA